MIVCVCHGISDRHIRLAISKGAASIEALSAELGVGTCCGCCRQTCGDMLAESACATPCHAAPFNAFAMLSAAA